MTDLRVGLEPAYPFRLRRGFDEVFAALREDHGDRPWFVVADARLLEAQPRALRALSARQRRRVVPVRGGESCKSLRTLQGLQAAALDQRFGRDGLVVAVGGGTVGDLVGFFAATWMRGVDWCPVATTSLAMADSALGGKTAVNLGRLKNLVGSFHQPVGVYGALEALISLPTRHRRAGLAEVIKSGIIADANLLEGLEADIEALSDPRHARWGEVLGRAAAVKADVVAEDPEERGRRAILNFGHTVGHALEASHRPRLLHGEAVSLGMIAACWISEFHAGAEEGLTERIGRLVARAGLPGKTASVDRASFWKSLSYDKKGKAGEARMVLTERVGSATFGHPVGRQVLQAALRRLHRPSTSRRPSSRGAQR